MATKANEKILILDFGSQYTRLIARRVREHHVYCEIHPYDVSDAFIRDFDPKGIILSGGPASVLDEGSPRSPQLVFELGVPVLGICYGMQTMVVQLGGKVARGDSREFGPAKLSSKPPGVFLDGIFDAGIYGKASYLGGQSCNVWMSHGDHVVEMPPGFMEIGHVRGEGPEEKNSCNFAAIEHDRNYYTSFIRVCEDFVCPMGESLARFYGVQFHPEVAHTTQGTAMFRRFLVDICGCKRDWNMLDFVTKTVEKIRDQVGDEHVILGLSGGVDSSVAAALIHKAIGKRLACVYIDSPLVRFGDFAYVKEMATKADWNFMYVHDDDILAELVGVHEPEQKRKIIGERFVKMFKYVSGLHPDMKWLAQGTIYPDVIESGGGGGAKAAQTIKSHHNVGGLPKELGFKLLEPLRELFKDEVREVGKILGLPDATLTRHPFPGPGLGVRVLGEVTRDALDMVRKADGIFIEELRKADLYNKVSQAFAVFLPVKSVGVMGDCRTYENTIALRAVETDDFMTAQWADLPRSLLSVVATRIVNEVDGINRVVYDISTKPPATIEWE